MWIWVAMAVFFVVSVFATYILRASGTWAILFAPKVVLEGESDHNPLASSPRGWIENHAFWDLVDDTDTDDADLDAEQEFWGAEAARDVG
jgi:hypothetical protein